MNRTVKEYAIAVLKTILHETLNQNRASRRYLIPFGKIEQAVFRAFGCKKEKQKRNSRGFIRVALQALIANDVIIGVQNFEPDADQLRRADKPTYFRPTTQTEIWFRDNCESAKEAMKTENIVRALQAFNLIPPEIAAPSVAVQKSLFDNGQPATANSGTFTDETALSEIRNRVTTNDAAPWGNEHVANAEPQPADISEPETQATRPTSLNEITPQWWAEFKENSSAYRKFAAYLPESALIAHARRIASDYLSSVKKISLDAAANCPLQWNQNQSGLDTTRFGDKTPIEVIIAEIFARAEAYSSAITTADLRAESFMIEALDRNATRPEKGLFSTDLKMLSRAYKSTTHIMARIVDIVERAVNSQHFPLSKDDPPPVLRNTYCEQIIAWRNTIMRRSTQRRIVKPTRVGFYLTPFGQLVAAILRAQRNQNRQAVTNQRIAESPLLMPTTTTKEGTLLKNSKKEQEKTAPTIRVPVRTKDGVIVMVELATGGGEGYVGEIDATAAELTARLGIDAEPVAHDEYVDDLVEEHDDLRLLPYRRVDLAKSAKSEVRTRLALRRHEDVIAFLVPDVVKVLCERIVALQNIPLDIGDGETVEAEEVCKVALYYALTTLARVVQSLQFYARKTNVDDLAEKEAGTFEERPLRVDFLTDYAAYVSLAMEALAKNQSRVLPLVTTEAELAEAETAASLKTAPAWSLQHDRKIEGENWLFSDIARPVNQSTD